MYLSGNGQNFGNDLVWPYVQILEIKTNMDKLLKYDDIA